MAQNQILHYPCHDEHHHGSSYEREQVGKNKVINTGVERNPFAKARHRQGCKQDHRALCKVKNTRRFKNQYKAKRDQGIQHAGHQAAKKSFKKKSHF